MMASRQQAACHVARVLWTALAACLLHVTIVSAQTTPAPAASAFTRNLKKLLERMEPGEIADGLTRFVFCSSHHAKGVAEGAAPLEAEWTACAAKSPASVEAHVACVLRSPTLIPSIIGMGQQITNMIFCLESGNSTVVLCSKRVQKMEDCNAMCPEARSAIGDVAVISSPALSATARKDDCKLSAKLSTDSPGILSQLNMLLDYSMKFMQCMPAFIGDLSQHVANHIQTISKCSSSHGESWGGWIQCLFEGHDVRTLAPYMVKARETIACVVGGDLPAQVYCIRPMHSAEECKACGGAEGTGFLDPVPPLGATNTCAV